MLTAAALGFAALLGGAAAAEEPITGAFGLTFDEPVAPARLGASLAEPPYPLPPGNLDQAVPAPLPGDASGWHLFSASARPDLLAHPEVRFFVLRDAAGRPVRILAEHPQPNCIDDMLWLTTSLARKYRAEDDPFGAARQGFRQSARFVSGHAQVDVSCGPALLIEYTDAAGYAGWLAEQTARQTERAATQAALAEQRELLQAERQRRFADTFTAGDRFRLLGVFGIPFGAPMDPAWLEGGEFRVDEPLAATPPQRPAPFDSARFLVTAGPDREPIRIAGELADPDASTFEWLVGALETKYGPPLKDSPRHRIHKVDGDYLIARYLPDQALTRMVFIDDVASEAQKAREAAARAQALAEQRRQFEEETAGL